MNYEALVKKIKKRRTVLLVTSILLVILLLAGSMTFTKWENGSEVYIYNGPIPDSTAIVLLIVLLLVAFFISVLNEAKVAELFNKECRPEAYLAAKVALCPARKQNSEQMRYVKMMVANTLGDFATCEALARTLLSTKNAEIRLAVLNGMANVCYARGSAAECRGILQRLDDLLAQKPRDGMRKKIEDVRCRTLITLYLCEENYIEAAAAADALAPQIEPISEVSAAYYQGLAYLAAGRDEDALYAFLTVQKKGGSTWYVEKALPLLEQARERLYNQNHINEQGE